MLASLLGLSGCGVIQDLGQPRPTAQTEMRNATVSAQSDCQAQGRRAVFQAGASAQARFSGDLRTGIAYTCVDPEDPQFSVPDLGVVPSLALVTDGVRVADVAPGSMAQAASIQRGDIIYQFGGIPVRSARELNAAVAGIKPDSRIWIKLRREGEEISTFVHFPPMMANMNP
jgi:S1-C subfamily serine protease